ncbi:hypothetical protein AGMMS49940_19500 [Spirochaetia bacterium]|nr:hypothetical protein AGMMS49940_19500 [Spirochaetia bacterium]
MELALDGITLEEFINNKNGLIVEKRAYEISGEVSDDSAKSIGQMVGAGAIVTGSLSNIGTLYRLTLKAIDVAKAVVAVSFPADITNDEGVRALLGQSSIAAVPRSPASQTSTAGSGTKGTGTVGGVCGEGL